MHVILFLAVFAFFWYYSPGLVKYVFLAPLLGFIFGGFAWSVSGIAGLPTATLSVNSFGIHCLIATVIWAFIMRDWK